ncbi:transcriptional activator ARO80 [Xylariaceae sp. FL0804]|nr:transcriptional activator ARO80 [Xylariaceae sp. FL0804]
MSSSHYESPAAAATRHPSSSAPPNTAGPGVSADGDGSGPGSAAAQHKRVYQACIPCRRRKVRCDLGSVDNPHDPPCVRCRRESKECFFSATRRKRKNDDDAHEYEDEYIIRNGRKRHLHEDAPPFALEKKTFNSVPLTPGGSQGRSQPLRPSEPERDELRKSSRGTSYTDGGEDSNAQMENPEAQNVMRKGVYGPHDALDLLYKAATDNPHNVPLRPEPTPSSTVQPSNISVPGSNAPSEQPAVLNARSAARLPPKLADPIDPRLLPSDGVNDRADMERRLNVESESGYKEALEAWSRFRFVRAGWFTREEAVKYIAYYYEYLSPMTPISPPTFRSPSSHVTLLTEEPILAVTLLTIASRYYKIPTTGGHCRSHAVHEELWRYLRRMIERCLWGQEAFGGGFCGSGADEQTSSTAPWRGLRKGSLRTLGTIESLMVLTEWHPRALHFPPDEAIDELMLPSQHHATASEDEGTHRPGGNVGGRRIESWLEPAWRSDRMCWMLLSNAHGLAYELGVFDDIDELLAADAITRPEYEDEAYRMRAMRIKRLLMIYLTQLAGRLGWTNMVPDSIRRTDPVFSIPRRRPMSHEGNTPGTSQSVLSNAFSYVPDVELDDHVIHCWVGVSNAMHLGNQKLFRSRKHTTDIIQSGSYIGLLKDFQPILKEWWKEFERFRLPEFIRHILIIEYEYVRIYVNSLALQAVVERCTNNAGGVSSSGDAMHNSGLVSGNPELSPQTQNYLGGLPLGHLGGFYPEDQEYVKEVVQGSRNLLATVVNGLLKGGYLKHAPVRTYFRIISGAMFLLKTFALGAPKSDVETSITLLDGTVHALRTCVVDDVHLGTRFGDLLDSLTTRLRDRFKYAPNTNSAKGRSPRSNGDTGKTGNANGLGQTNGAESGLAGHDILLREGLSMANRSSTPSGNISATPFDMPTGNFTFPSGHGPMFGATGAAGPGGVVVEGPGLSDNMFDPTADWAAEDQMWYLPPGPGLFQTMGENSNVTMTDQGVNVGGVDLLEFMAMDPPTSYNNMDPPTF